MARSIVTYHAIPLRQQRMRRLYRRFVQPGDLVFDVGAHAGNRVRAFAALGCRVVALEPQPDFARLLRTLFARTADVEVVEAAVADRPGRAPLAISERTPTVTTLSESWQDARAKDPDFAAVAWNRRVEVEVTTLDALAARFGVPAFVKIDVEGSETAVLDGLSHAVAALSFEYLPRALDQVHACADRLAQRGTYEFNWSSGESYRLASDAWMDAARLLQGLKKETRSGDVYARVRGTAAAMP